MKIAIKCSFTLDFVKKFWYNHRVKENGGKKWQILNLLKKTS